MKLNYKTLDESLGFVPQINQYTGPLARIMTNKDLPATTKARMKRVWRQAIELFKDFADAKTDLQKLYCKVDEQEELVLDDTINVSFKSDEDEEKFNEEYRALLNDVEHIILGERFKFFRDFRFRTENEQQYDDFLSALELITLEWLIDDETPLIDEKVESETKQSEENPNPLEE